MKNILTKIEFHYTYLIMALGLVLTGYFANLFIFTSLIIIHELGHFLVAKIFGYKIDKIIIYPYGGITKLDTIINTKIYKDLLVALAGVLFQSLYFIVILFFYSSGIIREYIYNLFILYHRSIFLFNLLPIFPLDGSKIINLIFAKYFNFNLTNKFTVYLSLLTIVLVLFSGLYEKNYSLLMIIGVLMQNIYRFYNEIGYVYNRFLLERYLYDFNYKSKKLIKDKNKMYKNKMHFFKEKGKIMKEKEYLGIFFGKKH